MDLITGLPIHPLINHGVAVLVPLAAIGALRPISLFRSMYVRANLIAERGSITRSTGL